MTTPYLLPHLIEAAAERDPDHGAFRIGDDQVSYAELSERGARFASALSEVSIGRGDPVGVYANKSLNTVTAMHGLQRAGAIPVPIDPMAPADIVARMHAAIGLSGVVVDALHAPRVARDAMPDVIIGELNNEAGSGANLSWDQIDSTTPATLAAVRGDDPAYMITTSGSTGEPKAIVHSHRSALRYAQLAAELYGLTPHDRLANVAPFHFDQSTFELYSAPMAGALTVLVPELVVRFPAELSTLLEREQISVWYSVPTILLQLLSRGALGAKDLSSLRWVLFGGEVMAASALNELMKLMPRARFSNVYGPAEVNQCLFHHIEGPLGDDESIPIGVEWSDTELRVMATDGSDGTFSGELVVSTSTMMLGYWRRPDLTAASIDVEKSPGGMERRWYRTGDLVEQDADGLLHFRGRLDRQVKIRGNRVELEAVEAAIGGAEGVVSVAAVVIQRDGQDLLVAAVEAHPDGPTVDKSTVRAFTKSVLPPHALPDEVVVVTSLPRTQSGKIDARRASEIIQEQFGNRS